MTVRTPYLITLELDEYGVHEATRGAAQATLALAEKSQVAIDAAMDKIKELGARIAETMRQMPEPPSTASVEFGLKLGADVGVIAKGTGEAHFVVTLEWKREEKKNVLTPGEDDLIK